MSHGTFYDTFYVHRPDLCAQRIGQETLAICGTARGMTSLVAYVCHEAGLFLGDHLGGQNYEDKDLKKILPPKAHFSRLPPQRTVQALVKRTVRRHLLGLPWMLRKRGLSALIETRNAAYPRWGFKIPYSGEYADILCKELRNPLFVVCLRNPIATARSIAKREPGRRGGLGNLQKLQQPIRTLETLQRLEQPFIAIDMDAAKGAPEGFLRDFAGLMQFDIPHQRLAAALAQPGYKRAAPQSGVSYSAA